MNDAPTIWQKRLEFDRARDLAAKLGRELRQMECERERSKLTRLPPHQRLVLQAMAERDPRCEYGYHFATIESWTDLTRKQVSRACKALRRLGFVRFQRGMWTDDGAPAGSGYCVTKAGVTWWETKEVAALQQEGKAHG